MIICRFTNTSISTGDVRKGMPTDTMLVNNNRSNKSNCHQDLFYIINDIFDNFHLVLLIDNYIHHINILIDLD
jgi:hypothetical protein